MKPLTANEIRHLWLRFWQERGHVIEPGASLIPKQDPTLLWINSGVAALKKYFDGSEIPPCRRITNVQKSIRTNDIENVGHTARHHTFFEMLGNFSIGDYFRAEMIPWAYEILTSDQYFGLPIDRLYFTYLPSDHDTKQCWLKLGVLEDHLIPLEGNFWQIGEGPCGPNTEVFFDRGEKYDPEHIGIKLLQDDLENDRYIEIWGIVFSQYNAIEGVAREDYQELPNKNIDTGAGLERIACVLQETETNFETDLFYPLIESTMKLCRVPYEGEYRMAYRVIADHIRTCTFALSDGATFTNEGRGYVLRRLLRRAMRYGRKLGIQGTFLSQLVDTVVTMMADFYPYLSAHAETVKKTIRCEEERFLKTLNAGEQLLRRKLEETNALTGEDAFQLYDTYGFPIELTIEMASEAGVSVDTKAFDLLMEAQKERARAARNDSQSMNRQSADLMAFQTESIFHYDLMELTTTVLGLFQDGHQVSTIDDEGDVIFADTVFYAESGGQVADNGYAENDHTKLEITQVQKAPNHQHLHHVRMIYGSLKEGDKITLCIDQKRRMRIRKNHSSAHLLQRALIDVLGPQVHQEGSYVDDEVVRFDFNHSSKVEEGQLQEIERKVNEWIACEIPELTRVLPIEEARKTGAISLFDEKYGSLVRVVSFGDISCEFCGGTHVDNTAEIGCFVIEYEESIASGIRRIQGRTGLGAYELMKRREHYLREVQDQLHAGSYAEISPRLRSLRNEKDLLQREQKKWLEKAAIHEARQLENQFVVYNGLHLLSAFIEEAGRDDLLRRLDAVKTKYDDSVILLIGEKDGQLPIVCYVGKKAREDGIKAGEITQHIAKFLGGSGGGRDDMASGGGKDKDKVGEALASLKRFIA